MNVNGVLASMCFPTMAGFNARTFTEAGDKELSLVMLQAYNDWHIDEWCARVPGSLHPARHRPDVGRRPRGRRGQAHRQEGLPRDQLPRGAARAGLPELPVGPLGPDARRRSSTRTWCCACTSAARCGLIQLAPEAPIDHLIVIPSQITMLIAQDLLFGPTLRKFPDLKVALSEGGIGWIPFYLDRVDRHFQNQAWIDNNFGGASCRPTCSASTSSPATSPTRRAWSCATRSASTSSPGSATTRTPTRRGRSRPSSPGRSSRTPAAPTRRSTRSPGRTPAASSTGTRSRTRRRSRRRSGALRALATDVDTTRMPREEWRKRNEAAGIGVF